MWWFLRIYFALMIAVLLLPVVVVMLASVSETSYLTVPPKGVTAKWFGRVLADQSYRDTFTFSLGLAFATVGVSLVIGMASAYAMARFPRRFVDGPIASFLLSPLVFPGIVIGVALLQIYAAIGLLGSFWSLLAAHAVITAPYSMRCVMTALTRRQLQLEDAARTLGANRTVAFFTVTLPLARSGLVAAAIMSFITSFDNVPVSIFILGVRQQTLPVRIFNQVEYGADPSVAAISTIMILGTAAALLIAERVSGLHRYV